MVTNPFDYLINILTAQFPKLINIEVSTNYAVDDFNDPDEYNCNMWLRNNGNILVVSKPRPGEQDCPLNEAQAWQEEELRKLTRIKRYLHGQGYGTDSLGFHQSDQVQNGLSLGLDVHTESISYDIAVGKSELAHIINGERIKVKEHVLIDRVTIGFRAYDWMGKKI